MSPACCGARSVRIIKVGNSRAGVTGLDQLLEQVHLEGWLLSDQGLGQRLVEGLRGAGNFVANTAEAAYAEALLGLYRAHVGAIRRENPEHIPVPPVKR